MALFVVFLIVFFCMENPWDIGEPGSPNPWEIASSPSPNPWDPPRSPSPQALDIVVAAPLPLVAVGSGQPPRKRGRPRGTLGNPLQRAVLRAARERETCGSLRASSLKLHGFPTLLQPTSFVCRPYCLTRLVIRQCFSISAVIRGWCDLSFAGFLDRRVIDS